MIYKDVIFLRADGTPDFSGDRFAMDSLIECSTELRIVAQIVDFDMIGMMKNIRRIDNLFIGDIHVYPSNKLGHETIKWLVPAVNGSILMREQNVLKSIKITRIDLDLRNADERIKNLDSYEKLEYLK